VRALLAVLLIGCAAKPDRALLDAGTWTRLVIGPDGGEGSAHLCSALAHDPAVFGVSAHGSLPLRFTVDLVFPDNEVSRARASVTGADPVTTGALAHPSAAGAIDGAIDALLRPLRTGGAISNAASVNATVRCMVRGDG
jgi:hypothetical protein